MISNDYNFNSAPIHCQGLVVNVRGSLVGATTSKLVVPASWLVVGSIASACGHLEEHDIS